MKKTAISIIASTAIAGALFVGCGSSSSGGVANNVVAQASYVVSADAGKILLGNCATNVDLNATNGVFKITDSQLNCTKENSIIQILPGAWHAENADDNQSEWEQLTFELKGISGKKVNIFSTIAVQKAIASGKSLDKITSDDVEEIDINDAKTSNSVKALKAMIQAAIKTGSSIDSFKDINITSVKENTDGNFTAILSAASVTNITQANIDSIKTALDNNATAEQIDNNITGIGGSFANLTKPTFTFGGVTVNAGDESYTVTGNDFNKTFDASENNITDIDLVVSFATSNLEKSTDYASNATLTTSIEKENGNNASLMITGVKISTDADKKVKVTLDESSQVKLSSTAANLSNAMTGTNSGGSAQLMAYPDTEIVNSNGKFSVATLIDNLSDSDIADTKKDAIKAALNAYLMQEGTYNLSVSVDGWTNASSLNLTSLENNTSISGTVTINEVEDDGGSDNDGDNDGDNSGSENNETETGGDDTSLIPTSYSQDSTTGNIQSVVAGDNAELHVSTIKTHTTGTSELLPINLNLSDYSLMVKVIGEYAGDIVYIKNGEKTYKADLTNASSGGTVTLQLVD